MISIIFTRIQSVYIPSSDTTTPLWTGPSPCTPRGNSSPMATRFVDGDRGDGEAPLPPPARANATSSNKLAAAGVLMYWGRGTPGCAGIATTTSVSSPFFAGRVRFMGLAHINNPNKSQRPISAKRRYTIY